MASIYNLKPKELFEVPKDDKVTICKLCLEIAVPDGELDLGPLYQYGQPVEDAENEGDFEVYSAHYFCLLFSPGLNTNGEDEEGIKGFLPPDILREWRRGQRLRCFYCSKTYATVGCCNKSCKKAFHLSCGIRNGSHQEFCNSYASFCSEHRPRQSVYESKDKNIFDEVRECGMCFDSIPKISDLDDEAERQNIWTPCCGKWFHINCVKQMASNAGYFFKCPMCNNKDDFAQEMSKFGVFIPEQDAAWEREGNTYEEIYERHGTCNAEECQCPGGRQFDEDYTIWEIILCKYCGAQGVHVKCGSLPLHDEVTWNCDHCTGVIKKMPPRAKHNFRRINNKKSSRRGVLAKILEKSKITVSDDIVTIVTKKAKLSSKLCPRYEVPLPVKLRCPGVGGDASETPKTPEKSSPEVMRIMVPNSPFTRKYLEGKLDIQPVLRLSPIKTLNTPVKIRSPKMLSSSPKPVEPMVVVESPIKKQQVTIKSPKKKAVKKMAAIFEAQTTPTVVSKTDSESPGLNDVQVIKDKAVLKAKQKEDCLSKMKQKSILSYFGAK